MKSIHLTRYFLLLTLLSPFGVAKAHTAVDGKTVVGLWKTVDDKTGAVKSYVRIYEKEGQYFGDIVKLFRKPDQDPDPICTSCADDDPRKNKKVIGMTIIKNMSEKKNKLAGGDIFDPKNGKVYACTLWLDKANVLKVRGWLGCFYRTQTWYRVEPEVVARLAASSQKEQQVDAPPPAEE